MIVGVVKVLLVKVSVVVLPINVSVEAGNVSVPEAAAEAASAVVPELDPEKLAPAAPIIGVVKVVLAVIDAVFILLRGIVFSQRKCDYLLFITSISVQSHGDTQN